MSSRFLAVAAFLIGREVAAFNLYPTVNPDKLARSFGISLNCLDALNATVNCDQDLFQWASAVDNYLWSADNVTSLCTSGCTSSAQQWNQNVQNKCTNENIAIYGKLVPVESVAGRFFEGLGVACLQSNSSSWCLIESQDWIGSDIIRPDCSTNATDPSCSDPTAVSPENERIANLYTDALLCSDCFLKMMHQRLSSPYLPNVDHSDYLVAQYQDIQDVCTTTMPALTTRDLPAYAAAPAPTVTPSANSITTNSTSPSKCLGQMIQPGTDAAPSGSSYCDQLSVKYGVTTGDLQKAIGNSDCSVMSPICMPASCSLQQVPAGASCDSLASTYSTATVKFTTLQFLTWNPNIIGLCDSPQEGQYICTGPPGGFYVLPPAPSGTDANAAGQQRGGPGGSNLGLNSTTTESPGITTTTPTFGAVTATATVSATQGQSIDPSTTPIATPTPVSTPTSTSTNSLSPNAVSAVPSPTQSGISTDCNKYVKAVSGDYCYKFAHDQGITPDQLYSLNPVLGSGGSGCALNFFANYYYCVGTSSAGSLATTISSTTSPVTETTTPRTITTSETSTTTDSSTTSYTSITSKASTTSEAPSSTPSTPSATSGGAPPAPSPTQSGIASNCTKYKMAVSGDYCAKFAQRNGISTDNLYAWNAVLGSGGSGCNTNFFANYYYCVGVGS